MSFLKGFVEHFGAEEVYQQAKYLSQDTQEGGQYFKEERERLKELLLPELLSQINRAQSDLQRHSTESGKERKPPKYDEAKKPLGG